MKTAHKIGLAALAVVSVSVLIPILREAFQGPAPVVTAGSSCPDGQLLQVKGPYGSEKSVVLKSERVRALLAENCLGLAMVPEGSFEMMRDPAIRAPLAQGGFHVAYPAGNTAVEYGYELGMQGRAHNTFSSQLVVTSRRVHVEALKRASKRDNIAYVTDHGSYLEMDACVVDRELTQKGVKWSDLGVTGDSNVVRVQSTNPLASNSGNGWAQFMAGCYAEELGFDTNAQGLLDALNSGAGDKMVAHFNDMPQLTNSSGKFFNDFLSKGSSAPAMVVNYENSLIAKYFSLKREIKEADPTTRQFLQAQLDSILDDENGVVTLYVRGFTYSHPLVVLDKEGNEAGAKFLEVLESNEFKALAFEEGGFRNGVEKVNDELQQLGITQIPPSGREVPKNTVAERIRVQLDRGLIE